MIGKFLLAASAVAFVAQFGFDWRSDTPDGAPKHREERGAAMHSDAQAVELGLVGEDGIVIDFVDPDIQFLEVSSRFVSEDGSSPVPDRHASYGLVDNPSGRPLPTGYVNRADSAVLFTPSHSRPLTDGAYCQEVQVLVTNSRSAKPEDIRSTRCFSVRGGDRSEISLAEYSRAATPTVTGKDRFGNSITMVLGQ